MSDEKDFFVGYGSLPDKDRRFILKAVPAGLIGIGGAAAFIGTRAASEGGGKWETGTPVILQGRIGFHPYPVLWVDGIGHVIAGIGKVHADPYCREFEGQSVEVKGVKITRNDCFMLGVAEGDIKPIVKVLPRIPPLTQVNDVSLLGEILDAQCYMGIMNPGYGRTHRGCATQCIRGGQPVFFSMGIRGSDSSGGVQTCGGNGYLLANASGDKVNSEILNDIAVPVTIDAKLQKIGNLYRLVYKSGSLKRL